MRTEPAPGSDPTPAGEAPLAGEDEPRAWGDRVDGNDERLKADKPPHWG
ncbi:MAG: hypothetical protein ACTHJL_02075 [Amnibacterium sp.]